MSGIEGLLQGLAVAITPQALLFALLGTVVGTLIGVLPGIGPALTIALLLPMTYGLEPEQAFIMFAGIYYGAMYGGSTTSILLKTPGESGSVVTAVDGNKMARRGRGAAALATAAIGSFVAGTIATLLLAFFAPWMVDVAVKLGAQDYFALMVVAFLSVSALVGSSPLRGLISMSLGLVVGLIGIDFQSGQQRLVFGQLSLLDGIDTVVLIVALFAMGEVLYVAAHQVVQPLRPASPGEGREVADARGLGAIVEAVVAGHRSRLPARRHSRGWRRDTDVHLLCDGAAALQTQRGIR